MPQLTFPVTGVGLSAPVWIGLDGKTTTALAAGGQPVAAPVQARGLVDTGSDVSVVASWVLQALGIPPATVTKTTTASGQVQVRLYEVSLSITDPGQAGSPWLTLPDLVVMELPTSLPDVDVLIGLDVLLTCRFLLDGPGRQLTFDF